MGQKTHPYGFRLGIFTDWKSRWFSEKEYQDLANHDGTMLKQPILLSDL